MSECSDNASIFAKEVFDEFGLEQATVTPHGTGPFVVQNWLPNERIEAEAVQDHWNVVPSIASLTAIEAKEAAVRSAMLRTNEVDISLVPISDVPKLSGEGFAFHDGLRRFQGHNVVFSGNYWQKTILELGDPVPAREGFTPGPDYPWIGDPWAEGCDIDAMLTPIVPDPADVCENMERARKVRWAMALAIDRDAINATILGGYGGPVYNGRGQNIFHHSNPEWKDKWKVPYDPERAKQLMMEAGYEDGFEWEFYCPAGIGVEEEVCLAVAGMWENTLNLRPRLDTSVYTAKRPTMVQRQINTVWMMNSSATRLSTQEYGVSASYCCLWARPTSGDWNTGIEIDKWYEFDHARRALDPESEENLKLREDINDFGYFWMMSVGVVEVPGLVGLDPDRVDTWGLRPLRYINSFDTIVLKN